MTQASRARGGIREGDTVIYRDQPCTVFIVHQDGSVTVRLATAGWKGRRNAPRFLRIAPTHFRRQA
jgi:hypothetical protein